VGFDAEFPIQDRFKMAEACKRAGGARVGGGDVSGGGGREGGFLDVGGGAAGGGGEGGDGGGARVLFGVGKGHCCKGEGEVEWRWKEWDGDGVEELRVLRGRFQQVDIRVASLSFCVRGHDLI